MSRAKLLQELKLLEDVWEKNDAFFFRRRINETSKTGQPRGRSARILDAKCELLTNCLNSKCFNRAKALCFVTRTGGRNANDNRCGVDIQGQLQVYPWWKLCEGWIRVYNSNESNRRAWRSDKVPTFSSEPWLDVEVWVWYVSQRGILVLWKPWIGGSDISAIVDETIGRTDNPGYMGWWLSVAQIHCKQRSHPVSLAVTKAFAVYVWCIEKEERFNYLSLNIYTRINLESQKNLICRPSGGSCDGLCWSNFSNTARLCIYCSL